MEFGGGIADLARWTAETLAEAAGASRPPRRALAVTAEGPSLVETRADGARFLRLARRGDRAPLLLGEADAMAARATAPAAAALHGSGAARFAAEAVCPFALDEAALGLAPAPEPWAQDRAAWRVAAAPRDRISARRAALEAAGARPGRAFALCEGAAVWLEPRSSRGPALALAAALALVAGGWGLQEYRLAGAEAAAEARRAAARATAAALAAEAEAASDPFARAEAAAAALAAAPPAAIALARFAAALPDEAHALRVVVAPGRLSAEIAAPDAAAVAARLGSEGFPGMALAQGARVDPATGLQRATLSLGGP